MTDSRTTVKECRDATTAAGYRAAFSLHAHTNWSRESMIDVSRYFDRIPIIGGFARREIAAYERRNPGKAIDFRKVWWHPPLEPVDVFDSERAHVTAALGLDAVVSITDHDTIDGNLELRRRRVDISIPVSLEWSVPFEHGLFHLGVHNLAPGFAQAIVKRLNAFTRSPDEPTLHEILEELTVYPGTLIVLNHPLWDLAGVGPSAHLQLLQQFLHRFGDRIHALELNGYRSRFENAAVGTLAEHYPLPLISGGDRHGCDPNAIVNLSNTTSFAEFAGEIRVERRSVIAILPTYRKALVGRKLSTASDAMRAYPGPAGRLWTDRVEFEDDGVIRSLSEEWPLGGPWWVRTAIGTFHFGAHPFMRPLLRAVVWLAGASRSHEAGPAADLIQLSASEAASEPS